jgi:cytochrome P450
MQTTTVDIPSVDVDVATPEFVRDPFALMEEWRGLGPVVYNAHHDQYMVFGYRDNAKVLSDVAHFTKDSEVLERAFGGVTMESLDTPRHHDLKGVWTGDFQRNELEAKRREMIERVVDRQVEPYVERLCSGEAVDAVMEMTQFIPTLVIAEMLGIEPDMYEQFSAWSASIGRTIEGLLEGDTPLGNQIMAEAAEATADLNEYIYTVMAERRKRGGPGDDLVSAMVYHSYAQSSMDDQEIMASNTQIVFAGNLTTAGMMANTLVTLAEYPDQRAAITADRSLVAPAFEEIHRWSTLLQSTPRTAVSDAQVRGVPIPDGSEIMVLLGAANRDPGRWDRPEVLDIYREPRQHLGFGFGMHVCLGLNLARLEVEILVNRVLDLIPEYELAAPLDYGRSFSPRNPLQVMLSA